MHNSKPEVKDEEVVMKDFMLAERKPNGLWDVAVVSDQQTFRSAADLKDDQLLTWAEAAEVGMMLLVFELGNIKTYSVRRRNQKVFEELEREPPEGATVWVAGMMFAGFSKLVEHALEHRIGLVVIDQVSDPK